MLESRKPFFVVSCSDCEQCTFFHEGEDGGVIITNHLKQELNVPADEWKEMKRAILEGRL